MTISISVKDLRKSYGKDSAVLKGLSLDLYQDEILALLGPNGSGKTTLIKILATLLTKDSGKVHILGQDLDDDENEIRHLFGYVGQDTERSAYSRLTVVENLQFFGALRGLDKRQVNAQIEKLVEYFDFKSNLKKYFGYLSGGQKQTVVIMRALLHDPAVIYLDEPTKGLDPLIAKNIRSFLKKYVKEEHKTLLLTSHILSEVDELSSRVALIHDGVIASVGTAQELKQGVGVDGFIELQKHSIPLGVVDKILRLPPVLNSDDQDSEWVSFGINNMVDAMEGIIHILREEQIQSQFRYRNVSLEDAFVYRMGLLSDGFEA
ncbi:MAG TPA: ABC transporter ATP-binding protein [Herpetosiphon sp.]|uniref:ABC transporter related n=1 Tax=Herpetosiphon aurantiacus (strain ATCC 23779 / DSM 785 / 114-95) TaxID=316274 RepID=A9AV19_HERA2|nr:ABC transporter ATP-binding protein [Herpetosiphon sp.]ABX06607.1 ABC transporter related [Herpetosiphon aurantiacus DSM 785]HBW49272.1 ABC transporter ATP-binding protein [Herpetosiphon sp.]